MAFLSPLQKCAGVLRNKCNCASCGSHPDVSLSGDRLKLLDPIFNCTGPARRFALGRA